MAKGETDMKFVLTLVGMAALVHGAAAADPAVALVLGGRQATGTPSRAGFSHTGGGNIDVAQPAPDTVVVTMTGVAVAGAHPRGGSSAVISFELEQCFEIAFLQPSVKRAKLTIETRHIGLLRSHEKGGCAAVGPGTATLVSANAPIVTALSPARSASCGQNLSVNDRGGPVVAMLPACKMTLQQSWSVTVSHPASVWPCKAASAEFAPDPALNPLWISYKEPFRGVAKKDFGFQVTLRVEAEGP